MNMPGIIILAAGLGTRFRQAGGVGNKLLAPLADGALLLEQTLAHAQASGLLPVVMTRPEYAEILTLAHRRGVRTVCLPSGGSGESIAAGVRAAQARAGWLIVPGDMAWITAEDHRRVAQALAEGAEQVRLRWQGFPGHPVGFSACWPCAAIAAPARFSIRRCCGRLTPTPASSAMPTCRASAAVIKLCTLRRDSAIRFCPSPGGTR
ncbi:nucleotidyltransferase family protein [Pluralibacter gergoviae]